MSKKISLPSAGILLVVGPSNSGKTTFLQKMIRDGQLLSTEVVSSDQFRLLVGDTDYIGWEGASHEEAEYRKSAYHRLSEQAFFAMDTIIGTRCRLGRLTVVDATHLFPEDRARYVELAKKHHVPILALALDVPEQTLLERDAAREHPRGRQRVRRQYQTYQRYLRSLKTEGFRASFVLNPEDIETVQLVRRPNPFEVEIGPGIDFIGDLHACCEELLELLPKLGYQVDEHGLYVHPEGRKFVSLGDVMSRGPRSIDSMVFFKKHVDAGLAYMIDSNHGWKIARWLDGRKVSLAHGDEKVEAEFLAYEDRHGRQATDQLKAELKDFLLQAPSNLVFTRNGARLVVAAHAGIRDHYIGKDSKRIRDFCRYGDTDGLDDQGKPIRKDWFLEHESNELIIWGHDPKPQPLLVRNTLNIDQGVVFGGRLTAYRYPEKQYVSVPAKRDYSDDPDNPIRQWHAQRFNPPNIRRFLDGFAVMTEAGQEIKVKPHVVKPVIDLVSHYTVPLEELVYIPPTMSPTPAPSPLPDYLEHPAEAFAYYRSQDIGTMIAEKKHMGSRAILLLFKDEAAGREYIGRPTLGTIHTRTGRSFFNQEQTRHLLERLNAELASNGYFSKHETDFVLLDAEILPWNLKAKELISAQYAHVSEAALLDRRKLLPKLEQAQANGRAVEAWAAETRQKLHNAETFRQVFQKYCWDVQGLDGIQIAPFHTLAHSGETFFDRPHLWHMEKNREFAALSDLFIETEYRIITDEASEQDAIRWWEELTEDGHEGFVVKPETFTAYNARGHLLQPAIKVRGRKYLHIIYGMDYLLPENLTRLKQRTVKQKQRHALQEFVLGMEGIARFVKKEPVERMHECVLATLAFEAEPVDPRL